MDEYSTLDACVERELVRWTVPGAVVGVLASEEVRLSAYGVANLEVGWPMRADMLFRVASISKAWTATLLMTLVDSGQVELDAPLARYLPDLRLAEPEAPQRITVRMLLTHTHGLSGDFFEDHGLDKDALGRAIARFDRLAQQTEPGTLWAYRNSGFHLAGAVVQGVLGVSFEEAMRERVFAPLGLQRTCFFAHEAFGWPAAIGHVQAEPGGDEHVVADQYYPRNRHPAGGVISDAEELLTFARMHLQGGELDGQRVLSAESVRAMQQPQVDAGNWADSWGLGWDIRRFGETAVIGHGGSINGFQSQLTLVPEREFALVVLTNSGRGRAAIRPIERWLLQHELGLELAEPLPGTATEADLARYAGRYRQRGAELTVAVERGGLSLATRAPHPRTGMPARYPAERLEPLGDGIFLLVDGPSAGERVEFIPAGRPRFARVHGRLYDRLDGDTEPNTAAAIEGEA